MHALRDGSSDEVLLPFKLCLLAELMPDKRHLDVIRVTRSLARSIFNYVFRL